MEENISIIVVYYTWIMINICRLFIINMCLILYCVMSLNYLIGYDLNKY